MKKCPKPLGYGIRRTPVVLGLSAALCMPAVFSYANVGGRMDSESVQSVLQTHTVKGTIVDETGDMDMNYQSVRNLMHRGITRLRELVG